MTERDPLAFETPPPADAPPRRTGQRPPAPSPARRSPHRWLVPVALLALVALVTVNSLSTESGPVGGGPERGGRLPAFAVPLAASDLEGDANVAERAGQGAAGERPACEVRGPDVLNSCQLAERAPAVLALFTTRGDDCAGVLDQLERLRARFPDVAFAAVATRSDRDRLRSAERPFPVGFDRDGAVASRYGMTGCPQLTVVGEGGRVRASFPDGVSDDRLARALTGLR